MDQVRQPFYLTSAAQAAAVEALRHQDEVERRVVATIASRDTLLEGVRELGLWVAESDANFIWVRLPDEDDGATVAALRDRGVLVRGGSALGGAGCIRVTVGTDAENERFVSAFRAIRSAPQAGRVACKAGWDRLNLHRPALVT